MSLMAGSIGANRLCEKRRQAFAASLDALPEPVIGFVHRGQSAMHFVAARVEPAVDGQSVSFRDFHHCFV
jgi:hypothetical protein